MRYEFHTTLTGSFEDVLERVKAILLEEQLGIVSEINVQAIFKAKMDKDIVPYRIFGACNPKLAAEVLAAEPNAGTLLPCNFVMYESAANTIVVSFMDPDTVLGLAQTPEVKQVGKLAKEKLLKVLKRLAD